MIEDPAPPLPTGEDGEGPTADEESEEPVELLVQLAEDGDIDPWDIDIVAVTDAYLSKLESADLRVSGRALFYASVLLRMKSDVLVETESPEPEDEHPPDAPMPTDAGPFTDVGDPIDALETEIDRRLDRKRVRGTPETLDELIRELRDIERRTWWKPAREYDTSESPRGFRRGSQTLDYHTSDASRQDGEPTVSEVNEAAHGEDLDDLIAAVERALMEQFEAGRREVLFAEIEAIAGSRMQTFLGVLFLAHRGQVDLVQDDLFGDLWIVDPSQQPTVDGA